MGFVIKKITVHSDPTKVRSSEDHYNMIREKWDVRSLLEVFCIFIIFNIYCVLYKYNKMYAINKISIAYIFV